MWLFDTLVWSVVGCGVQIWEWKEWRGIEAGEVSKVSIGVDRRTPVYMVKKEMQKKKIRKRAGDRT